MEGESVYVCLNRNKIKKFVLFSLCLILCSLILLNSISMKYCKDYREFEPRIVLQAVDPFLGHYPTNNFTSDIVFFDHFAFIACDKLGMLVLDIFDPTNPTLVSTYYQGAKVHRIFVKDDLAYLGCDSDGLQIVNISDPYSPSYISHLNWTYIQYPEAAGQIEVIGNFAYVCDLDDDFKVINVTDPYNPNLIGSCFFTSSARGLAIKDNYAYIAGWNNRLVVIDISDPTNPIEVFDDLSYISYAQGVQIKKDLIYISDWENGIHIYNISNPAVPVFVKTISMEHLLDINIFWQFAFVADTVLGMQIFNLHDPLNPFIEATYSNDDYTSRVVAYDEYVFVANGLNGLLIYDTYDLINQSLVITLPPETITNNYTSTTTVETGIMFTVSIIGMVIGITTIIMIRRKRKV